MVHLTRDLGRLSAIFLFLGETTVDMDFDKHSSTYDEDLEKGLVLSGESASYFANGRVDSVKCYLDSKNQRIESIIEFGCGSGNNIHFLRKYFPQAWICGLDLSSKSMSVCKKRYAADDQISVEEIALHSPPPPVDLVFVNGVFHHIHPEDHGVNLDYIQSILKPGGLLVIFENNPFNPGARWVMSRIPFDQDAVMVNPFHLLKQITSRNFVGSFLNFFFIFPKILAGLRRFEKRFINLPIGAQYGLFTHKRHN